MKTKRWTSLCMALTATFYLAGCQNWGEVDDPSGNQKVPEKPDTSAKLLANFTFEENLNSNENETLITGESFVYTNGNEPEIINDSDKGKVLHLNGGYLRIPNPLKGVAVQTGASISMFVKMPQIDIEGALFSFTDDGASKLFFTANAFLNYDGNGGFLEVNKPTVAITNIFSPKAWHYVALTFTEKGYAIYIDGKKRFDTHNNMGSTSGKTRAVDVGTFDYSNITKLITSVPYLYIGYGAEKPTKELYVDEIKVFTNTFSDEDAKGPNMGSAEKMVAEYKFDGNFKNSADDSQVGELITVEAQATPSAFFKDPVRGMVWQQQEGWPGNANGWVYTQLPNPLKDVPLTGITISMWMNPTKINHWDQVFVLNDGTSKYWLNAAGYMGFNGKGGFFDCNQDAAPAELPVGSWSYVTVTITPKAFAIYVNGELTYHTTKYVKWAGTADATSFDYQSILNLFTASEYLYLGYETFWRAAPCMVDDLRLYNYVLSSKEIMAATYSATAYYDFSDNLTNLIDAGQVATLDALGSGTVPQFETDVVRGSVLHQHFGAAVNASRTTIVNPLQGRTDLIGATVSAWVKREDNNNWDAIWSFFDEDNSDKVEGKLYLSPNAYLGFNGTGGYFDCNWPESTDTKAIAVGEWSMVTTTFDATGFAIYVNGAMVFDKNTHKAWGAIDGITASAFNYNLLINLIKSSPRFYLGHGSWWGSAALLISDLMICDKTLTAGEISKLYTQTKK